MKERERSSAKNRHLLLGIAGVLLVSIGLMALWWPVSLSQFDRFGMQIGCGSGYTANMSQAVEAGGNGLVAQCGTALLIRRLWAIPMAVIGWVVLTAPVAAWVHHAPKPENETAQV